MWRRSRRSLSATFDSKAAIRKAVLQKRDGIDILVKRTKDSLIKERVFSLPQFTNSRAIFYFATFRSEVDTLPHINDALKMGKRVILPRVDRNARELRLYEIIGTGELSPGFLNIPEPDVPSDRERGIDDVDIIIMPGAAFDHAGNRLGYGGGYYDKLLSRLEKPVPLIAIAYEEQIFSSIPHEAHDIQVHMIVTDERIIDCLGGALH
jgi:5-formyltetrahydrofolate cyclo-ligase